MLEPGFERRRIVPAAIEQPPAQHPQLLGDAAASGQQPEGEHPAAEHLSQLARSCGAGIDAVHAHEALARHAFDLVDAGAVGNGAAQLAVHEPSSPRGPPRELFFGDALVGRIDAGGGGTRRDRAHAVHAAGVRRQHGVDEGVLADGIGPADIEQDRPAGGHCMVASCARSAADTTSAGGGGPGSVTALANSA